MIHLPAKPVRSNIEVAPDFNSTVLSWKNPRGGISRYVALIFLIAWMGGWVVGEVSVTRNHMKDPGQFFLLFWLTGWTVGGLYCLLMIVTLARPSRPERLTLDPRSLQYEPGTEPIAFGRDTKTIDPLMLLRPKRAAQAARKEIGEIKLDRVGERQRLTVDIGAKRVEIGEYLEEPEREWLLSVLQSWQGR